MECGNGPAPREPSGIRENELADQRAMRESKTESAFFSLRFGALKWLFLRNGFVRIPIQRNGKTQRQ